MANIPPEGAARAELEHVRSQLTSLVERRLAFGLTGDEEAEYRRLTDLERDLLRRVGAGTEAQAAGERPPEERPG